MKNTAKRLTALALMLIMALSLCACGNSSNGGTSDKQQEETPEYIYNTEFKPLLTDSERNLNARVYTDTGFYATSYEKIGERELNEGEVLEYEGQLDVYGTRLFFVDYSGSFKELTGYTYLDVDELIASGALSAEGFDAANVRDYYSGSDVYSLGVASDGRLITVESAYLSYNNAPTDVLKETEDYYNYYNYSNAYFVRTLDADGNELSFARLDVGEDQYLYAANLVLDENDNMILSGDGGVFVYALDGSIVTAVTDDSESVWVDSVSKLRDGRIVGSMYGENGMELRVIDVAGGKFGDTLSIPNEAYNLVPATGGEYDAYYSSGTNFYGIKFGETNTDYTTTKLFSWINCDINGDNISRVLVRDDGSVITVLNEYDSADETFDVFLATISLVPYDSVPHKEELTLATQYLNWNVRSKIVSFNRKNDNYRIVIKDYSEFNTEEDYSAGRTKLTTELLAGNVPDIIDLSGLPYTQLAGKGLLQDLYPLIDADSDLNRDDFFASVLSAREVNGGLYSTVDGFSINTVMGATSIVGEEPGWTYDEFNAALATMRETVPECDALGMYTTQSDILRICLMLDMNDYVNWATGEVKFDTPQFVELLNFAADFPESFDYDNYEYTPADNDLNRITEGRQMLMQSYISDMETIAYYDTYFGGNATYIGFPTSDGSSGSLFDLDQGYAISAKSEYKDAAWSFLRELFTEKYQSDQSNVYSLPSNKAAFDKRLKEAMTPDYQKDVDGNYVLDEEGNKIPIAKISYGTENGTFDIYSLSQEQADKLLALINSTTAVANYADDSVFDIVSEQSQAFFAGQKSAEEVAKLVQSKANIYVNEQR